VRRSERQIEEKRLFSTAVLVHVADRLVGEGIRHVEVLRRRRVGFVVEGHLHAFVEPEVIAAAADEAEVLVEPAVGRPVGALLSDVPLTGHQRRIPALAQSFRNRHATLVQTSLIRREAAVLDHVADPGLVRVQSGQQGCACGAAPRGVVELRKADTPPGEPVEVRRSDLGTIASEIGEAHIVSHDQHDIRPFALRLRRH
jgi:hypothetical protein